jgi:DnaJ family protein C protein 7
MNFFSKSPKKSKKSPSSDDESQQSASGKESTNTHPHRSRSPLKKSSSSRSGKAREDGNDHSQRKPEQGSPRNSRSFPSKSNSPRHPFDPSTTHPLNLPVDQLRRFSALSAMSDPDRMDVDSESPQATPVSPPPQSKMAGGFDTPKANGSNGASSGVSAGNGEGPVPPPHKSNPTSPAPAAAPTPEEAEAFKNAGNKFYKSKDYIKAIEEYTKGNYLYILRRIQLTLCSCRSTTFRANVPQ